MNLRSLWVAWSLSLPITCLAQPDDTPPDWPLVLTYAPIDLPFGVHAGQTVDATLSTDDAGFRPIRGMGYASMEQSLQIYTGLHRAAGWGIHQIPVFPARPALRLGFDALLTSTWDFAIFAARVPLLSQGWLHEEWHRAVMVASHVNSANPFSFRPRPGVSGQDAYAVDHVRDENLVRMKARDSSHFARMSAAGGEGQLAAVARMQKEDFFHGRPVPQSVNHVLNTLNVVDYLAVCGDKQLVTERTLAQIDKEGSRQAFRDAKGFDFTAWAYDLFHPGAPYEARGLHPHGNGFDRYIYGDKLTRDQYAWIRQQSALARVSFFSPMNLFVAGIPLGERFGRGNLAFRYFPTSFGNDLGLDVFLQTPRANLVIRPHLYQNHSASFPALGLEWFEHPLTLGDAAFLATVEVEVGAQPRQQRFFGTQGAFVGRVAGTLKWEASETLLPYAALRGKTRGWALGNPFLEESIGVELGVSSRFGG